jgi:LysM repeat protein
MTATAFANDPVLDLPNPFDAPLASEAAMDRWFDRPHLEVIEGAVHVDVPAAQVDPMVEVYRRRRFAIALALTAVVLLVSQLAGLSLTSFGPTSTATDESTPVVHVVRPGDTYAGIAAELGVDHPQSFASELQAANGFAELTVGQRLVVDLSGLTGSS